MLHEHEAAGSARPTRLREGFDVNNICVIVPLRSSQAQILLEQTIGRGLRLMWRDPEYADIKRENRERINRGEEPGSLIDILSIVEHPAFQSFYDELMREGLVGSFVGRALPAGSCFMNTKRRAVPALRD